jgi:aspartate dehydrogenase
MHTKVGIAGMGAIGRAVAKALQKGIHGYELYAASDITPSDEFNIPYFDFEQLCESCDLIIEALPPAIVPELTPHIFAHERDVVMISSSALLLHPEILAQSKSTKTRIIVPSGALSGLDGVSALMQMGIKSAAIATTKKPMGYDGAPYIVENNIDLSAINDKEMIFKGSALEASKAFPANINVAATLSLAGIGAQNTQVEIWADPNIGGNTHEIKVIGEFSTITAKVENTPDPANPKSSMLAAQSIISVLKKLSEPVAVL